eukprot:11988031-Ditylum_brightwellii.AAC.1
MPTGGLRLHAKCKGVQSPHHFSFGSALPLEMASTASNQLPLPHNLCRPLDMSLIRQKAISLLLQEEREKRRSMRTDRRRASSRMRLK